MGLGSLRAGVIGDCEPPGVSAGYCKSSAKASLLSPLHPWLEVIILRITVHFVLLFSVLFL